MGMSPDASMFSCALTDDASSSRTTRPGSIRSSRRTRPTRKARTGHSLASCSICRTCPRMFSTSLGSHVLNPNGMYSLFASRYLHLTN